MRANIVGYDWETCYLNEFDSCVDRKNQILEDLGKEIQKAISVGETLIIDVADHSFACEMFEVMAIFPRSGIVKLEYRGGAS